MKQLSLSELNAAFARLGEALDECCSDLKKEISDEMESNKQKLADIEARMQESRNHLRQAKVLSARWKKIFPMLQDLIERMKETGFGQKTPVAQAPWKWSGNVLVNSVDGQEFVHIPAGEFHAGSSPLHLDAYAISRYPATNAQYAKFIEAGGYQNREFWTEEGWNAKEKGAWNAPLLWENRGRNAPGHPVVGVSWFEASAYCRWAGSRLPSAAQWTKAARGGLHLDGDSSKKLPNPFPWRVHPWGDAAPGAGGIWRSNGPDHPVYGRQGTSPVGSHPSGMSPYGCLDMAGNAWEWCADSQDGDPNALSGRNPPKSMEQKPRLLLGGSWFRGTGRLDEKSWIIPCRRGYDMTFRSSVSSIALLARFADAALPVDEAAAKEEA